MTSPLWGNPTSESGDPASPYFLIPFGLLFALVGAALSFHCIGLTLNSRRKTVEKCWGIFIPFRRKIEQLQDCSLVCIYKEVRRSDKSSYTVYPLRFNGLTSVDIIETRNFKEARQMAEQIAKSFNIGVSDSTGSEPVVREAGELDESLRDRVKRLGEDLTIPAPPETMISTVEHRDHFAKVSIPAPQLGPVIPFLYGFAGFSSLLVFAFIGFPTFFSKHGSFDLIFAGFICLFAGAPIVAVTSLVIRRLKVVVTILVSPKSLEIEEKTSLGTKKTIIPVVELEELSIAENSKTLPENMKTVPPVIVRFLTVFASSPIHARSDDADIGFGRHLPVDEKAYLRAVILDVICN